MLAWITEKLTRTDNPATTEADVRAFLEALPLAKPAIALDDIGERIAGVTEPALDPAACRRALKQLDDAAQALQGELWMSVFSDGLGTSIFDASWRSLAGYQRTIFCAYMRCLADLPAPAHLDDTERQDVSLLANRAMAALASHKALMRIRYRDPHPEFWTDANAVFARALHYGVAQFPVRLYPHVVHLSTVEREYVTALLLEAAPTGNLLPTQTHCLHLLLRHFDVHYCFDDSYSARLPFFIEPAKGKPPQRWLVGLKPRPGVRFFGFGDAYPHLDALREAALSSGAPPKWVQQSRIDADRFVALIDTLTGHWSENPPQRRSRRDRQVAAILATHGFSRVYHMVAYSKFAKEGRQLNYAETTIHDLVMFKALKSAPAGALNQPADRPSTPMEVLNRFEQGGEAETIERWSVIDTSDGGLGATAERHSGWLRAGMLVGYRYHDSIDWRIATVRRLRRTTQGKLGVGLRCLAETVGCARLRLANAQETAVWTSAGADNDAYADAILVGGAEPMLLGARGTYAPGRVCDMAIEKCTQTIRFVQLIECGVDFECISFSFAHAAAN